MVNPSNRDELGRFLKGTVANPGGRPKESVDAKLWCRALCEETGRKALKAIIEAPNHPDHAMMLKFAWEQAYGKATQRLEGKLEQAGKLEITLRRLDANRSTGTGDSKG